MKKLILILLLIPLFSFSQQSGKFRILQVTELLTANEAAIDTMSGNVYFPEVLKASNLISSSSPTTGALQSAGGLGVVGNTHIGGIFNVSNDASTSLYATNITNTGTGIAQNGLLVATNSITSTILSLNYITTPVFSVSTSGSVGADGSIDATNFISDIATGTQPYAGVSTTLNDSLNADLLDGYHASELIFAPSTTNTYIPYDSLGTYVNSPMVTDGTNVGIGTNPSQKLDVAGNININTNGTDMLMSSYKGANSDGDNSFIGGGGQSSIGEVGVTYKGSYNSAHGVYALYANTTGYSNSAQGYAALYANTTGFKNSAQGYQALYANTTGYNNSAQGSKALFSNTTGNQNSAQGYQALLSNTTGYNNSAQGYNAGTYIANGISWNQDGDNSIFIGTSSKANATSETNQIVIGCDATGKGNNTTVIGNASVTDIYMSEDAGAIVHAGQYKLSALNTAPASAAATGTLGEIRVTATYIYICTATDTWVRVAVATW